MEKNFKNCSCHDTDYKSIYTYQNLQIILPDSYSYIICTYEDYDKFIICRFHVNCYTKDEVNQWLEKFSNISKTTFTTEENCLVSGEQIKVKCLCRDSVIDACATRLKVVLKGKTFNNNQTILNQHPAYMKLHFNHFSSSENEILYRKIPNYEKEGLWDHFFPNLNSGREERLQKKLYLLFDHEYSPQQIYNLCKVDIKALHKNECNANKIRPGLEWVYQQYHNYVENKYEIKVKSGVTELDDKPMKQPAQFDTIRQTSKKPEPLDKKIDELCQRYVPILPATQTTDALTTLGNSIISNSLKTVINNSAISNSYIIKFNAENKADKLNLFPLKLIPTTSTMETEDYVAHRMKIPELKIAQNESFTDHHTFQVIQGHELGYQSINIPSGVDGIMILTDEIKIPNNKVQMESRRKQRRKSNLKCDNNDEFVFTNDINELEEKVDRQKNKKRKVKRISIIKKQKVVLPCALNLDGIENVICSE